MTRITYLLTSTLLCLFVFQVDGDYEVSEFERFNGRIKDQIDVVDGEWHIRGTLPPNGPKFNPLSRDPITVGWFSLTNKLVLKFKVCKDEYSYKCKRYMEAHTPFVVCLKTRTIESSHYWSSLCPAGYFSVVFNATIDDNIFSCNLLPELIEFYDNCVQLAIVYQPRSVWSEISEKDISYLYIDGLKIETPPFASPVYDQVTTGFRKYTTASMYELYVYSPNPKCGLYLTPISGQAVMNSRHGDSEELHYDKRDTGDDDVEKSNENSDLNTDGATTLPSVAAAGTASVVWIYVIIGVTALISLIALPFVIRILYLELCRKNKTTPPPAPVPLGANGSGQMASGGPADMSGKGAEMSNATDNGSKDPFVKEESKKKQGPVKHGFIGPVRKEPSAKQAKQPLKPSQEASNVATARPSIVPPTYVMDDENRVTIHKRICEILPTKRRLQRGPDDMHRMALVEDDPDRRHDYLNEAIHTAELEIDWMFNDHNKDKKNKSPPNVDNLSHIGKRIAEARRRHIRPPAACRKGDFRNEHLYGYDYAQVYDFALIEEYDLKARYFYFEYALTEIKAKFDEWVKNKAIFDPCSVDPLILQYDLALEEKQKNYNGELSQVGWDSSPIVHHPKRTKEAIVPPTNQAQAPPTDKAAAK